MNLLICTVTFCPVCLCVSLSGAKIEAWSKEGLHRSDLIASCCYVNFDTLSMDTRLLHPHTLRVQIVFLMILQNLEIEQ